MNIICFLTHRPSTTFYNICKNLIHPNYDMYICIDDNSYSIPEYDNIIKIIKVDNKLCEDNGFKNTVMYFRNKACSRDKALYYFSKININYTTIWFIEEDVFIPNIKTIENLDNKYIGYDLMSSKTVKLDMDIVYGPKCMFTKIIKGDFDNKFSVKYYLKGMICAIRVSRKMMIYIELFANKYSTLGFDEVFFNTLALENNLLHIEPEELDTIKYNDTCYLYSIKKENLYHPVKDINKYNIFLQNLDITFYKKLEIDKIKVKPIYKFLIN